MTPKKILYATDYSDHSRCALAVASSLARDEGATLIIAHVSELEEYPRGELFDEEHEPSPEELKELHAVEPLGSGIRYEHRLLYGKPVEAILKLAKREEVSKIVVGSHGHTALMHLLTGNVAEGIFRQATCTVVVVKHPAKV